MNARMNGLLLILVILFLFAPSLAGNSISDDLSSGLQVENNGTFIPEQSENGKPVLYFFFNQNCAECLKTLPYIDEFGKTHPNLVIRYIDIRESSENLELFHTFSDYYGKGFLPVPTVFIDNMSLTGYDEITENLSNAANGTWGNIPATPAVDAEEGSAGTLTIPLVIMAALADGINPCAFAVLIFLIISLMALESRKKMMLVGATFIFAVFCFYFLSGLGIFAIIQSAGISRMISIIAAALAITAGLISILSVIGTGKGPALLSIPERGKGIIEPYIRKASVPAAFILGILVGMFELPCTGGIYLAILSLLSTRMTAWEGIPYLLVYNMFFILPLVIILCIFAWGLPLEKLEQWHAKSRGAVRLIMGIVMILLGLVLIIEIL